MIATHQDLAGGQFHEAHQLRFIPSYIAKMDQKVVPFNHLAAIVEDEIGEPLWTPTALEHVVMTQMGIGDQVNHRRYRPFHSPCHFISLLLSTILFPRKYTFDPVICQASRRCLTGDTGLTREPYSSAGTS